MVFLLRSELTFSKADITEKSAFESLIIVNLLKEDGRDAVVYNKELKIYIENPAALEKLYEIELHKIFVDLTSRMSPANDFTRRLMYRYDWIQVKMNTKNKVVSIENKDELLSTWKKIKKSLLEDYKGRTVERYIAKMEHDFENQDFMITPMSQYFYFGLIFPGIPPVHDKDWTNKRTVKFSDYDKVLFEEQISFDRKIENLRLYNVSGNTSPGSDAETVAYSGLIRMKDEAFFPSQADISIGYRRNNSAGLYQWKFNLEQY